LTLPENYFNSSVAGERRAEMTKKKLAMILLIFCFLSGIYFLTAQDQKENAEVMAVQQAIANENLSWQARETSMSLLSESERLLRLGGRLADVLPSIPEENLATAALPVALDWRNKNGNWITSVKDQGACGSCWAFATTAVLESMVKISKKMLGEIDLSEQMLVSCSHAGDCVSGYDYKAANYIRSNGITNESCYPYTANYTACNPCAGWTKRVVKIKSWNWVSTSINAIETALQSGPITTYMRVYDDFYHYSSGIYKVSAGAVYKGGHFVTIVGYNHTSRYWICKNSWGTNWGERGFFRIQMGQAATGTQNLRLNQPISNNATPVLKTIAAQSAEEGVPFSLTLNATDADDDPITYNCRNLPLGATIDASTGVFSWTPDFTQSGIYSLQFTASDGMSEAVKTGKITVKNVKIKQW
jgi:C1A family cysteine protease